jgi:sodium-dependent dicarboxylate transporter 2/3/5
LGKAFHLSKEGKASIALFMLAGTWWVFEVIPIGLTSIAIGVFQALFAIRSAKDAFRDFMDPSVMFIFGSMVVGLAFTKTGLTRRLAYKMLEIVGERTDLILLGSCLITGGLALFMAHTAVAATVFPILMLIYALYGEEDKPTRFGSRSRDGRLCRGRKCYQHVGFGESACGSGDVQGIYRRGDRIL